MKYCEQVNEMMWLVNSVLRRLNIPELTFNNDFGIDQSLHLETYVKFILKKANVIGLAFTFMPESIQVDLGTAVEVFSWSNVQIQEGKKDIIDNIIVLILTSTIKVELCGSNYRKYTFVNADGKVIKSLKYISGLYSKINCSERIYNPIYPVSL